MTRVLLTDVDRPKEPLEVDILESSPTLLKAAVPNTIIAFTLRRYDQSSCFEGHLGGRTFTYELPKASNPPPQARAGNGAANAPRGAASTKTANLSR